MKFSKKLLTALAVLMLAVLVLVSCDQTGNTDGTGNSTDDVTTAAPGGEDSLFMDPENIQIFVSGEGLKKAVNFSVVRPRAFLTTALSFLPLR